MSSKLMCPSCSSDKLIKKGFKQNKQRYKCKSCGRRTISPSEMMFNSGSTTLRGGTNVDCLTASALGIYSYEYKEPSQGPFKAEFKENGNSAELNVNTKQIKTLNDLVTESEIDLSIWKIDSHIINKWDGYSKGPEGKMVTIPLFQVKVYLSKIIPDKVSIPTIQPIEIKSSPFASYITKTKKAFKKALIIPDIQAGFKRNMSTGDLLPFHDRRCLSIALKVARKIQPEKIILLGDNIDFAEISRFTKTPEFYFTVQPTIIELAWWLAQLRMACPNAEIQYLEGNHEARLWKTITENAIFAYGLKSSDNMNGFPALSVPNLLGLDKLKIEYSESYPTGEFWINDNLRVSHGLTVRTGSGDSVKEVLKNARCSEIFGHIHRLELASKTVYGKNKTVTYTAFSPGCFCHLDGRVPSFKGKENWQQGFGVVEYEEGNGRFQINQYSINDGATLFDGEVVVGDEKGYLEGLKRDTKWKF